MLKGASLLLAPLVALGVLYFQLTQPVGQVDDRFCMSVKTPCSLVTYQLNKE
jgi:hypothetical protein